MKMIWYHKIRPNVDIPVVHAITRTKTKKALYAYHCEKIKKRILSVQCIITNTTLFPNHVTCRSKPFR